MDRGELKETAEKLRDALKTENGGMLDESLSFDDMDRRRVALALYLAIIEFLRDEF